MVEQGRLAETGRLRDLAQPDAGEAAAREERLGDLEDLLARARRCALGTAHRLPARPIGRREKLTDRSVGRQALGLHHLDGPETRRAAASARRRGPPARSACARDGRGAARAPRSARAWWRARGRDRCRANPRAARRRRDRRATTARRPEVSRPSANSPAASVRAEASSASLGGSLRARASSASSRSITRRTSGTRVKVEITNGPGARRSAEGGADAVGEARLGAHARHQARREPAPAEDRVQQAGGDAVRVAARDALVRDQHARLHQIGLVDDDHAPRRRHLRRRRRVRLRKRPARPGAEGAADLRDHRPARRRRRPRRPWRRSGRSSARAGCARRARRSL